jgi:hypothetical protein
LAWQLFRASSQIGLLIPILVLLVFSGIALAGVFLWRGHQHAETLTAFAQWVQVPIILSPTLGYYCIAGIGLQLKAAAILNWSFYFHLGSQFRVSWGSNDPATTLGVNVVPLLALYWLIKQPETTHTAPSTLGAV